MLDGPEFDRWQRATDDAVAGAEAQRASHLHNWACFLAEQAAQLAVKGLLRGIGEGAWGHDLVDLGARLADALGTEHRGDVDDALRRLARHYIPARYPDAHPSGAPGQYYGDSDSATALADVATIRNLVDRTWADLEAAESS